MRPLPFRKHLWRQVTLCLMLSEGFTVGEFYAKWRVGYV